MSCPKGTLKGVSRIANTRVTSGTRNASAAIFFDRYGNPIPNSEVIREVAEASRRFWEKRGRPAPFASKHALFT